MKFNWRANWEILLVLVIIVVGIVITTIAAIRNKDKHLLVLPDESDFAGQLLVGGSSGGSGSLTDPAADSHGANQASDEGHSTRRPQPIAKSLRPAASHQAEGSSHRNHQTANRAPSNGQPHDAMGGRQSKFDDIAEFTRPLLDGHQQSATISSVGQADGYEQSSTEPAPYASSVSHHSAPNHQNSRHYSDKRHVSYQNRTTTSAGSTGQDDDESNDPVDVVDDIHTTRSSSAGDSGNLDTGALFNGVLPSPHLDHTPSLSLHGPYGMTTTVAQLGAHSSSQKGESYMDNDDMMTSYPKGWSSSNLTDALVRGDYNLASSLANQSSSQNHRNQHQASQLINMAMLSNLLGPAASNNEQTEHFGAQPSGSLAHHRAYQGASLPVSVLLADLLKLTRAQPSNLNSPSGEPPANVRPPSILQQLRSLPSPLISLLQGLASGNNGGSGGASGEAVGYGGQHDMSESNQHYHRISMSPVDIHSILARSIRGSGTLPAFPAPKGVQQPWIPPTAGGDPGYQAVHNSNADFVANNAAGFVRDQQQVAGDSEPQSNSNEPSPQQYKRQSQEAAYQRPGGQDMQYNTPAGENSNQQVPLGAPQQQQQQSQKQSQQQQQQHQHQQQQQTLQQPPVFVSQNVANQNERSWPPTGGTTTFKRVQFKQQNGNQVDFGGYQQQPQQPQQQQQQLPQQTSNVVPQPFSLSMIGGQAPVMQQQAPVYNSRPISEMPVPLGYNAPVQSTGHQQIQIQQSPPRASFEYNAAAVESKPKITVAAGPMGPPAQLARGSGQPSAGQVKSLLRRRRSTANELESPKEEGEEDDKLMSGRYSGLKDEEDDADSPPISVVRPDGRPMTGGRVKAYFDRANRNRQLEGQVELADDDRQVAQSQRSADHLAVRQRAYKRSHQQQHHKGQKLGKSFYRPTHRLPAYSEPSDRESNMLEEPRGDSVHSKRPQQGYKRLSSIGKGHADTDESKRGQIDTAGSGLMSRLLGTASSNDEIEDEFDEDDGDSSNEKRKEELEDAEFGITNDNAAQKQMRKFGRMIGKTKPVGASNSPDTDSSLGSGSADSGAYARRNQQRSDIEFYGHPGEETRQLKYGILGSGNYEVVEGGIYSQADESTAAVNSVANYVRKPSVGNSAIMSPFMPGDRLGGFMRGASGSPNELLGVLPVSGQPADYQRPLLELIDANVGGQLFDPSLLSQLGSSGSSARTTHASKEESVATDGAADGRQVEAGEPQRGRLRQSASISSNKLGDMEENELELASSPKLEDTDDKPVAREPKRSRQRLVKQKSHSNGNQQQQQHIKSSSNRSHGANQFNSYQISPSKKVAIFSDQDLDSAPSNIMD